MYNRTTIRTLILLALFGVAPLLGACHTTAGAGEDISKTGQAIEKGADKAAPWDIGRYWFDAPALAP